MTTSFLGVRQNCHQHVLPASPCCHQHRCHTTQAAGEKAAGKVLIEGSVYWNQPTTSQSGGIRSPGNHQSNLTLWKRRKESVFPTLEVKPKQNKATLQLVQTIPNPPGMSPISGVGSLRGSPRVYQRTGYSGMLYQNEVSSGCRMNGEG